MKAIPDTDEPYLTTAQIAAKLGVTPQHIRNLIEQGVMRAIRTGKHFRITCADFADYLKLSEVKTHGED